MRPRYSQNQLHSNVGTIVHTVRRKRYFRKPILAIQVQGIFKFGVGIAFQFAHAAIAAPSNDEIHQLNHSFLAFVAIREFRLFFNWNPPVNKGNN